MILVPGKGFSGYLNAVSIILDKISKKKENIDLKYNTTGKSNVLLHVTGDNTYGVVEH